MAHVVASFYPDIGRQIRDVRADLGWSQAQLGRVIGRSHAAVSDIETGKTKPNVDELVFIAAALGTTLEFLLWPVLKAHLMDVDEKIGRGMGC